MIDWRLQNKSNNSRPTSFKPAYALEMIWVWMCCKRWKSLIYWLLDSSCYTDCPGNILWFILISVCFWLYRWGWEEKSVDETLMSGNGRLTKNDGYHMNAILLSMITIVWFMTSLAWSGTSHDTRTIFTYEILLPTWVTYVLCSF